MVTKAIIKQRFVNRKDLSSPSKMMQETYPKITILDTNFDSNQKNEIIYQIEKILNQYRL